MIKAGNGKIMSYFKSQNNNIAMNFQIKNIFAEEIYFTLTKNSIVSNF